MLRNPRLSPVWLVLRLWLGLQWFQAGWHKVLDPAWMAGGEGVRGYWMKAAGMFPNSKPLIKYAWYESFIRWLVDTNQHAWFAKFVAVGEVLVGVGLMVGGLTLVAAFFGALMNLSYMLAGTTSSNPLLYTAALLLLIAGPASFHLGLDRFILPKLKLGTLFRRSNAASGRA